MAITSTIIYCVDFQTYIAHIHSKVSYNISQFQTILKHMNTYIVPTMYCVIVGSFSSKILAPSDEDIEGHLQPPSICFVEMAKP
jgi:hypothetical protein